MSAEFTVGRSRRNRISIVWKWGTTADDDNFTLDAGPEPGSLALLATALIGLGAIGWSRRRRA